MGVVNHDISRLNVAMHYPVSVNEVQSLEIIESAECLLSQIPFEHTFRSWKV